MELALMFALLEYDKRRHGQGTYQFFSKILWPLMFIQAGSENYIGIDGLFIFDLQMKKTEFLSSDSTILSLLKTDIGDPQARLDLLSQCVNELNTPLKGVLRIKGVIGPDVIHGLVPLIKLATDKPTTAIKLEPVISTDSLIGITTQYNQALKNIEETISKWHLLQQNIHQNFQKWQSFHADVASSTQRKQIEEKYQELDKKILDRVWDCRNEIDYLLHWAISGRTLNLIIPITEIWISMYLAGIILPNNAKKFLLLPPSILSEEIKSNRWVPVDAFHSSFYTILKDKVEGFLASQSPLTQTIETKCRAQNLFLKEEANKLIARGFIRLQEKKLIEPKYIKALQEEWQKAAQNLITKS
jgi:hypothetical protein